MGQGNQTRALVIISQLKGWDPTEIIGTVDAEANPQHPSGLGTFADMANSDPTQRELSIAAPSWESETRTPDVSRENKSRHTTNANPTPARPGA